VGILGALGRRTRLALQNPAGHADLAALKPAKKPDTWIERRLLFWLVFLVPLAFFLGWFGMTT